MFNKPLATMSDAELAKEHAFWDDEISSANRWGASQAEAIDFRRDVEREQRRRRVARRMAERVAVEPFVVDDPGVRLVAAPLIKGTMKARAEYRPPRGTVIGAAVLLALLLVGASALASQRLVEMNDHYAAMEGV
ncbi:MAG TPA: hypothetical protein VFY63_04885 [Pseudorhizobium sp.]|nr:hypothetical protein [Pseudorhizobium sp.]